MKRLIITDYPFIAYFIFSCILITIGWFSFHIPAFVVWNRLAIIIIVLLLIYFERLITNRLFYFVRIVYPVILSGYFYSETYFFNRLFFKEIDLFLIKADQLIFGFQPSLNFSEAYPSLLLSEIMYFAYFSFYLIIIAFVIYMFKYKRPIFVEVIFKLGFSMYFFYFIFAFIPSYGPQFYFIEPQNQLPQAYFFSHIMHFIQKIAEQPTGAFPSSHVGLSIIILGLSYKKAPTFFNYCIIFVILLILSTVYIKAHYAIDIIVGLTIAPFVLHLTKISYSFLQHKIRPPERNKYD